MLDLSTLDTVKACEEGAELVLKDPRTDEPLFDEVDGPAGKEKQYVKINLVGCDSPTYVNLQRKNQDRRLNDKLNRGFKLKTEEAQADSLDLAVACTQSWENVVLDAQPLAFSPANARRLYTRMPWIREQVTSFIASRANFLGNS